MQHLRPAVRHYPWGSTTLIPTLAGVGPSDERIAEYWFGAHPASSAEVEDSTLDELIAADPQNQLGERVAAAFHDRLPFLLKLLSADEPLSLQAHPSEALAAEGFARENALGLALDDPQRNYKDTNHKPELIVALTEFKALAGFRALSRTRRIVQRLECEALSEYLPMLDDSSRSEEDCLREVFTTWITMPTDQRRALIDTIVGDARKAIASGQAGEGWTNEILQTVIDLNERYPGDIGVLGALLLHHVHIQPGEAIHLKAGQLHAYLEGMGVEVMANSDNVLRGGLTSKYVDIPELLKVLDFRSVDDPVVQAQDAADGQCYYPANVEEFGLYSLKLSSEDKTATLDHDGPCIVMVTSGEMVCRSGDAELTVGTTQAVWLPAHSEPVQLGRAPSSDHDLEVFIARA